MSLILEALRKLEREKQTPERGLVVTGASTWARAEERRGLRLGLIVLAGLALGAGVWIGRGRGGQAPATAAGAARDGAAPADRPRENATPAAALEREPTELRLAPRIATRAVPSAGVATDAVPTAGAAGNAAVARSSRVTDDRGAAGTDAPARDPGPPAASQPAGVAVAEPAEADDTPTGADASAAAQPVRARTAAASNAAREHAATPPAAATARPAASPEVVLQAVTERDGRPLAIVNGRPLAIVNGAWCAKATASTASASCTSAPPRSKSKLAASAAAWDSEGRPRASHGRLSALRRAPPRPTFARGEDPPQTQRSQRGSAATERGGAAQSRVQGREARAGVVRRWLRAARSAPESSPLSKACARRAEIRDE